MEKTASKMWDLSVNLSSKGTIRNFKVSVSVQIGVNAFVYLFFFVSSFKFSIFGLQQRFTLETET